MTNKTNTIATLNDICDVVTDDNIQSFLVDLNTWVIFQHEMMQEFKKQHPEFATLKNSEIGIASFEWTDDGVNKITGVEVVEHKK